MKSSVFNRNQLAVLMLTVATFASACTKNDVTPSDVAAPHTGYEVTEDQIGAVQPEQVRPAQQFYISAESIRVRTSPDTSSNENIAGRLSVNDKVEVLDATPIGKDQFVKIRVVSTTASLTSTDELYVSSKYFNAEPIKIDPVATSLQAPNTAV